MIHYDICQVEDLEECFKEHNPDPNYEDHHYGCECEGCLQWYWTLKN